MDLISKVSGICFQSRTEGCHKTHGSKLNDSMDIVEKTSAIAIGIFAACVSWDLFIPFFFIGICVGIYSYIDEVHAGKHTHAVSSCAQGVIEQLTGVKLPHAVCLAASIATTVVHIDHHPTVFVPIMAVSVAAWLAHTAAHHGVLMHNKIHAYLSNSDRGRTWAFAKMV